MTETMAGLLTIQLLGAFKVHIGGHCVADSVWQRRHAKQLVKLLAVSADQQLHRDQLLEFLWPEQSPDKSSNSLNKNLHLARRVLEPNLGRGGKSRYLVRTGELIKLRLANAGDIDLVNFESTAELALQGDDCTELERAATLYKGDLLPEDRFNDYLASRRDTVSQTYQRLLQKLAQQHHATADLESGIHWTNRLLEVDPSNEPAHRQLMGLYQQNSQRQLAIAQFHKCEAAIRGELDQAPDESTITLFRNILESSTNTAELSPTSNQADESLDCSNRIAVMPFENLASDENLDYLCEGLTDSLIVRLSRLTGLNILARSTVFRYQNQTIEPMVIRQRLSVDRLITGRLRANGQQLQIWVDIVDTQDGSVNWANFYELEKSDMSGLQIDIPGDIANQLSHAHTQPETSNISNDSQQLTDNEKAFHEYLKGRHLWNKRTATSLRTACHHFRTAIDDDPLFAVAYSGLADCYNVLSLYSDASPHSTVPKARAAAEKALAINPQLAQAHASLGYLQLSYDWDFARAEQSFQTALQLDSKYATSRQWYHKLLIAAQRFSDAKVQIKQALQLDPLSMMITTEQAWGLYYARRFPQAAVILENLLAESPEFAQAHYVMGLVLLQTGDLALAVAHLQAAESGTPSDIPFTLGIGTLGYACACAGDRSAAETQLQKLSTATPGAASHYAMALIFIALRQPENALASLRIALQGRYDRMLFWSVDPLFDELRGQPEFKAIASDIRPINA